MGFAVSGKRADGGNAAAALMACGAEASGDGAEDFAVGTGAGQKDADASGALDDARNDLEQTKPQRRELADCQWRAGWHGVAHNKQEPVSAGVQDEAELVGARIAAGGSVGSQLALVQLDEVLGPAAGAIDDFLKMLCAGLERGHDIADVQPFRGCLDTRHEAALLRPVLGAVAEAL